MVRVKNYISPSAVPTSTTRRTITSTSKPEWITDLTYPQTMVSPKFLKLWQPKELLRGNLFKRPPPDQLDSRYAKKCLMIKASPARVLRLYESYSKKSDSVDERFLVRVFNILAQTVAHPNCFFTTADRQRIVKHLNFKKLCFDIMEKKHEIRAKEVPQMLFSMAILEYRFWQIGEHLLCNVEANYAFYRFETLATVIWSLATLNLGGSCGDINSITSRKSSASTSNSAAVPTIFGVQNMTTDTSMKRDFSGLFPRLVDEVAKFLPPPPVQEGEPVMRDPQTGEEIEGFDQIEPEEATFWAQIMFSCVMMQHWDTNLPLFMEACCRAFQSREQVDACGWTGYYIYMTLYSLDVLKPKMPFFVEISRATGPSSSGSSKNKPPSNSTRSNDKASGGSASAAPRGGCAAHEDDSSTSTTEAPTEIRTAMTRKTYRDLQNTRRKEWWKAKLGWKSDDGAAATPSFASGMLTNSNSTTATKQKLQKQLAKPVPIGFESPCFDEQRLEMRIRHEQETTGAFWGQNRDEFECSDRTDLNDDEILREEGEKMFSSSASTSPSHDETQITSDADAARNASTRSRRRSRRSPLKGTSDSRNTGAEDEHDDLHDPGSDAVNVSASVPGHHSTASSRVEDQTPTEDHEDTTEDISCSTTRSSVSATSASSRGRKSKLRREASHLSCRDGMQQNAGDHPMMDFENYTDFSSSAASSSSTSPGDRLNDDTSSDFAAFNAEADAENDEEVNEAATPRGHAGDAQHDQEDGDQQQHDENHDDEQQHPCDAYEFSEDHRDIEIETKRACPMWIQERLHEFWLDGMLLKAQPQGSDELQLDVEKALNRTQTKASINTSVGREFDEQHCFFAGHLLKPNIALEYNSMSAMGPQLQFQAGNNKSNNANCSVVPHTPGGFLSLKQAMFSKFGARTATIHRIFWDRLTEDQKDEQIIRLRSSLGYLHTSSMISKMGYNEKQARKLGILEQDNNGDGGQSGAGGDQTVVTTTRTFGVNNPTVPNNDPNRAGAIKKTDGRIRFTNDRPTRRGYRPKEREKLK
ncbi:unnamed protein product [Amoebophrya sp. A120]|nr:unnamed protein product [Amoebophrya sp. A120]|eukprot:GSA120T00022420001.1